MKTRYLFIGYWYIFFGGLILIILTLPAIILPVMMFVSYPGNQTGVLVGILLIGIFSFCVMLIISGKNHFQWVIVDQKELVARCLWKVLIRKKWTDICEVKIVRFPISVSGGFYSRWFVFEDGTPDTKWHNYIMSEKKPIMIKFNKRSEEIVKKFWGGKVSEEEPKNR
ncbi:MAG: hypothetical protein WC341_12235 [Bacteroidales bacterium]